ncbi:complement factor H-like [Vanacampus margaritifer]
MNTITQSCVLLLWMHSLTFGKCQVIKCKVLEPDNRGTRYEPASKLSFLPGASLTVACGDGYWISTPQQTSAVSTCKDDGQWTISPICQAPLQCGQPPYLAGGDTTSSSQFSYQHNERVEYNCQAYYVMEGQNYKTCKNGEWVGQLKCLMKPCPIPEDTPNGNYQIIEGDDLVFRAIIKYFCNPGYQMVSKIDTRTCLGNKWSGHVPTCEPKRCPQPPEQDGITIEGLKDNEEGFLPQNFITFSCNDPGKQLIGRSTVVCGQDGLWEKSFPYCEDISCKVEALDPHLSVDNVSPRNQAVRIGHKIRFRCSDEYALDGFEENECLPNGQWDKLFPTCTKLCQLTHIPATIRLDTYLQGTQARQGQKLTFSCRTRNQVLQGKAEVECLPNGQWSNPFPTCAVKPCPIPEDTPNGNYQIIEGDDLVFGAIIKYFCNPGYQMVSKIDTRTCLGNKWSGHVPTCERVPNLLGGLRCAQPPYLDGGDTTSSSQFSYQHNERVEYICKQYYVMEGRNYKTCENGEWVGQLKCLKPCTVNKELMSRHNIQFKHARDKKIYSEHDDTIEFRCGRRTRHDGILGMRQKCIDGEIELPTCEYKSSFYLLNVPTIAVSKCKVSLPAISGTSYTPAQASLFSPGAKLTVTCGDGYWIETQQQTSAVSTCNDDGQWTIRPICQEVTCSWQEHSSVWWWNRNRGEATLGTTVSYSCRSGYKRTSSSSLLKCTRDGWIPDPPCQEMTCDRSDIQSAKLVSGKQTYTSGEWAHFECKASQDSFDLYCNENGWEGHVPCPEHQCKQLDLSNADIKSNKKDYYSKNEHVQYTCSNDPDRKFTATCDWNGWTGILNCSECLQPEVLHGFVVGPLHDTVYYTCNQGFKLASKGWWGVAQCIDGQWFGLQECVANDNCVEMPVIAHATIKHQIKINGQEDSLQIMCKEGYQPQIDRLMCVKGKWDSDGLAFDSICTFAAGTCNPPPKIENAVIWTPFQRLYLPDSKVTFKCREQYMMEGKDTSTCQNGHWDIEDIKCIPPLQCGLPPYLAGGDTTSSSQSSNQHNERVEYICKQYYVMEGQNYMTCKNGEWVGQLKCLKPCTVNKELMSRHNIQFKYSRGDKIYCEHDDAIEFKCVWRTRHDGILDMRQKCIDGEIELPTCQ